MTAGALWCLIPAALRAWMGVNETITTLLMNYIALLLVDYLIYGPWEDPQSLGFPLSPVLLPASRLPVLVPGTRVHWGSPSRSRPPAVSGCCSPGRGGASRSGSSGTTRRPPGTPRTSLARNILLVMGLAGALAGLAGAGEVSAIAGRLERGLSPGYGYTAIIVAWLARLDPLATVLDLVAPPLPDAREDQAVRVVAQSRADGAGPAAVVPWNTDGDVVERKTAGSAGDTRCSSPATVHWLSRRYARPKSEISQTPRGESALSRPSCTMPWRAHWAALRHRGFDGSLASGWRSTSSKIQSIF